MRLIINGSLLRNPDHLSLQLSHASRPADVGVGMPLPSRIDAWSERGIDNARDRVSFTQQWTALLGQSAQAVIPPAPV